MRFPSGHFWVRFWLVDDHCWNGSQTWSHTLLHIWLAPLQSYSLQRTDSVYYHSKKNKQRSIRIQESPSQTQVHGILGLEPNSHTNHVGYFSFSKLCLYSDIGSECPSSERVPDHVTGNGSLSPCTWPSISCDAHCSDDGIALGVIYYETKFKLGSMDFSLLPNLASLALPFKGLTGWMTLQICKLLRLACLDLSDNSLSDELPHCLGNLTMLEALDLQGNWFRGPIPPELKTLKRLVQLILRDNNLDGTIPSSKGNLSNLTYLYLKGNQFLSGSISSEIGVGENFLICFEVNKTFPLV